MPLTEEQKLKAEISQLKSRIHWLEGYLKSASHALNEVIELFEPGVGDGWYRTPNVSEEMIAAWKRDLSFAQSGLPKPQVDSSGHM